MIKLTCKSCGAKLELENPNIGQFSCLHCGTEWLLDIGGGVATLKPIEQSLNNIEQHSSRTADGVEVLASEVKRRKIREKIEGLKEERKKLGKIKFMKLNPKWIEANQQLNNIASSDKNSIVKEKVGIFFIPVGFIVYWCLRLLLWYFEVQLNKGIFETPPIPTLYPTNFIEIFVFVCSLIVALSIVNKIVKSRLGIQKDYEEAMKLQKLISFTEKEIIDEEKQAGIDEQIACINRKIVTLEEKEKEFDIAIT